MFVSQAINQDGSCQNVVNKLALGRDKDICISTSAYCQARTHLSVVTISNITKKIAIEWVKSSALAKSEKRIKKNLIKH